MNSLGDCAQPVRAMIDRVHRCDDSGKNRRRANVARRSVATDVLLTRLERESIGGPTFLIVRNAHQSTGHVTFVLVAGDNCRPQRRLCGLERPHDKATSPPLLQSLRLGAMRSQYRAPLSP